MNRIHLGKITQRARVAVKRVTDPRAKQRLEMASLSAQPEMFNLTIDRRPRTAPDAFPEA